LQKPLKNKITRPSVLKIKKIGTECQARHLANLAFVKGPRIEVLTKSAGKLFVKIKGTKKSIMNESL